MNNLVLLGPPGSGKGTQSNILVDRLKYNHVSTGDLLRAEVKKGGDLGKKLDEVLKAGELVTDELVTRLLKENIDLSSKQYIFDGFPRNQDQAAILDSEILGNHKYVAVLFDLDLDKLVERITNRRVSADGKYIYNMISKPPKVAGICDITGLELVQRSDDKESVVRNRIEVYKRETEPMVEFYNKKGILKSVDAEQSIDLVTNELTKLV